MANSSAKLSLFVLRLGLGCVFLAYGIGKFRADEWTETMRSMEFFRHLPWSVDASILSVGFVEVLTGTALILGARIRLFSLLASLELVAILALLYFQGIAEVRDIGLLASSIALFLNPIGPFSVDSFLRTSPAGPERPTRTGLPQG